MQRYSPFRPLSRGYPSATTVDIAGVTAEQIGKASKVFGPDNKPFYQVENSKGDVDADGYLIQYKVTYSRSKGFQCTCKAGQYGFSHCKSYCWHVKAAVACAREAHEAIAEQIRYQEQATRQQLYTTLGIASTDVDTATLKRLAQREQQYAKDQARRTKRVLTH